MSLDKKEKFIQQIESLLPDLLRWTISKIASKEDAEDIVQEVFIDAYQKIDSFEEKSSTKTWLFSILNHKIIDYYRKKNTAKNKEENLSDIETILFQENGVWKKESQPTDWDSETEDNEQLLEFLKYCINHLPETQIVILQYKYFSEKKSDEICAELGITKTNYWQILHRIRLQLRACIEKQLKDFRNG